MSLKKSLFGTLIAATALSASFAAQARPANVYVEVAPPPPREEAPPPPRAHYVWAPGYWEWRGDHHEWVEGHYIHEHAGRHWVSDGWVQEGPHWRRAPGHWE